MQKNHLDTDLNIIDSQGTFYALIDFSSRFISGEEACDYLLEKHGILATPGSSYGNSFKSFVRICLTTSLEKIKIITDKLAKMNPIKENDE